MGSSSSSSPGDGGGREPGRNVRRKAPTPPKPKPLRAKRPKSPPSTGRPDSLTGPANRTGSTPRDASGDSLSYKAPPSSPVNAAREARIGPSKNLTKSREKGEDVFKTPSDFSAGVDRARNRGPSPGDVMATFGAVDGMNRDVVAANVAGRPGLNVANMGQLATRARVGQLPEGRVTIPGLGSAALNVANIAGKKMASSLMKTIAGDAPTMKDGKVSYGTTVVTDSGTGSATSYGNIAGVVEGGRYTGRGDFDPDLTVTGPVVAAKPTRTTGDGGDASPTPAPAPPSPVVPSDLSAAARRKRVATLGAGSGTAAQRKFFG